MPHYWWTPKVKCTVHRRIQNVRPINDQPIADIAREFVSQYSKPSRKIYGHVGFNYVAYIRGQAYHPGRWPLLSLMDPRSGVILHPSHVTICSLDEHRFAHGNTAMRPTWEYADRDLFTQVRVL